MPSIPIGALSALGKLLSAKARAIEEAGLSTVPWFHGGNAKTKVLDLADKPLWLGSPELANMFTGGGRRASIEKARQGGVMYPFLVKGEPIQMGDDLLAREYQATPESVTPFLNRMGLDTQDFFRC